MNLLRFFIFLSCLSSYGQEIFITEIFADPTPSRGLPEAEFLEIYNASDKDLSLKGYYLTYGNTVSNFPDSILKSHEYGILCRSTHIKELNVYGKTIGLPNLSLNNTGATLRLFNAQKKEIQYISYSLNWYVSTRNEGYSLEMIDLGFPCVGKANWTSSISTLGATPAKLNSVSGKNPDNNPPKLLEYSLNGKEILLVFDEVLHPDFGINLENFEIIKGNNEILTAQFLDNQRDRILLTLDTELEKELQLIIYTPLDCTENTGEDITVTFIHLPTPQEGEIQLSEILFNPKTGGQDFVEIYNTTEQAFNLKDWKLAHINSQGNIASIIPISTFDLILNPKNHVAFTTNKDFLQENYRQSGNIIQISGLPAYNNDAGTVILLKPDSTVFDRFAYSEKMHSALINNPDGVSLEKVSFRKNQNRWASASADSGYATPGTKNSQNETEFLDQSFMADPIVFNPYETSDKSKTFLTYNLTRESSYATIIILDKNGRKVRSLGQNILLGTSGKLAWDGTDDYGRILPVGYYVFSIRLFGNDLSQGFFAKTVIGSY